MWKERKKESQWGTAGIWRGEVTCLGWLFTVYRETQRNKRLRVELRKEN